MPDPLDPFRGVRTSPNRARGDLLAGPEDSPEVAHEIRLNEAKT
jgi:hypothetical protein